MEDYGKDLTDVKTMDSIMDRPTTYRTAKAYIVFCTAVVHYSISCPTNARTCSCSGPAIIV